MSLEEIRKSIEKEARSRAESVEEEGAAEASAILREAKARAAEILAGARAEAGKEAERIKMEHVSGAQVEIGSMLVSARESVLEKHMPSVRKGIASRLSGKQLDRVLSGAARQFARFAAKDQMVVRAGKKNVALAKRLGYQTVPGKENELAVESKDGSISIDASPQGLADRHSADARRLLAQKLWKVKD